MVLFLLLFASLVVQERRKWKELIPLSIVVGIFAFYTIYSFVIRSNVPKAILKDLIIQIKPFLGFYCAYLIAPQFTNSQKLFLSILCLVIGGGLLVVGLTDNIYTIFGHPSRFATAAVATAFLFLYCNSFTWNDIFIFIFLLTIGFFPLVLNSMVLGNCNFLYDIWKGDGAVTVQQERTFDDFGH